MWKRKSGPSDTQGTAAAHWQSPVNMCQNHVWRQTGKYSWDHILHFILPFSSQLNRVTFLYGHFQVQYVFFLIFGLLPRVVKYQELSYWQKMFYTHPYFHLLSTIALQIYNFHFIDEETIPLLSSRAGMWVQVCSSDSLFIPKYVCIFLVMGTEP